MSLSKVSLSDPTAVRLDDSGRTPAYFSRREPIRVDRALIAELKAAAAALGHRNIRLCLHADSAATFQQMMILEYYGRYLRPHKHLDKEESYHVIEGSMAAFIFDENGIVQDACTLSADDTFLYRVGTGMYHAVMPLSDLVIYHECKPGPFIREGDSIWPDWAPDSRDEAAAKAFIDRLMQALRAP